MKETGKQQSLKILIAAVLLVGVLIVVAVLGEYNRTSVAGTGSQNASVEYQTGTGSKNTSGNTQPAASGQNTASENQPATGDKNAAGEYQPGTYTYEAIGFGGPVQVALTVGENGGITEVQITGDSETPDVGGKAIPQLADQILTAQSAEVDGVSGASLTSQAVKDAAAKALAAAGGEAVAEVPKPEGDNLFVPGTYTGTSKGFGGDITVTVTVSENKIEDLQIEGDHETENIGSFAVEMLGDEILEAQSPKVDALSGATVSSNAILRALNDALVLAGADLSRFAASDAEAVKVKDYIDLDCDIVIIGAGGAGMTAAINATQAGKKVIVLEKMPYVGGNTTKATGGMNAAETHYQAEQGIEDSVAQFVEDTMKGGHYINDEALVTIMAQNSASAIDWLDSIGAPLPKVSFSGGATNKRIHAPEDGSGVGAFLVTHFRNKIEELGIDVMYNTTATCLTTMDGTVTGVMAESPDAYYTIHAKAVILATGGFGNNQDMIVHYRSDLLGTVTTSAPGVTGDGIMMAIAVGADLVDIDQIQLHPTVEQSTSMLITESVRGDGAILVNQEGKRFINELLTRDVVSAGELEQTGSYAYIIFDQHLRDNLKAIEKYVSTGITVQSDTIEGLAEELGIDPATLADTLATWNQYVADKKDPDFGRDTGMDADLSTAPYYAIKIAPGIHHTMGGVKINTEAQVIDTEGAPIPGLFAAGEVCGGVHGGNRIGGNAVADIVVFGRIASESAVKYCDGQ
ncbi:MAG: flavocytochrome c [Lachnospiraceae bacterium]|nr:flavocytochrome c [Lachnospiraceae bacterium]